MPQGKYMPEGLFDSQLMASYINSEAGMTKAMETGAILQGTVTRCDSRHNLYCDVGAFKGIIPRNEAVFDTDSPSKEIAVISRVGKPVCFKIIGFEKGLYILSRRAAQKEAMEYFLANLSCGDILRGRVTHIEPFGVFVDIGCGNVSLIGIENISISRISSPHERFRTGQEILCAVKYIDRSMKRITMTHKELLGTWRENVSRFNVGETVRGIIRGIEDYGIFVELAPNLSGLAEYKEGAAVGQEVSVYIKSIIPEKMKVKLLIIDTLEQKRRKLIDESDYYVRSGHMVSFRYSPPECTVKKAEIIF